MKEKATYLLAAALIVLVSGFFTFSNAQKSSVGVLWDFPADSYAAQIELGSFKTLGITHIELQHPVDDNIKPFLRDSSLSFWIRSTNKFLTVSSLQEQRSSLRKSITELVREYNTVPNLAGIGVVTHSQTQNPDFLPLLNSILNRTAQEIDASLYFVEKEHWYRLSSPQNAFGVYFDDSEYQRSDLIHFSDFMSERIQNEISFVHSKWLLHALQDYPELEKALQEFTASGNWDLPIPNTRENPLQTNWMVLILFLLWISLTLQVRFLPYVRAAIIRYFFAHRFFVDDILGYRERAVAGGILQMITHAIFGGLVFFMTSHLLFSDLGIKAIFNHFSWLSLLGQSHYSFFAFGFGFVLVSQFFALLWLHLPAKHLTHFSQTLNLYSGIFYIDYVIITLMLTLFTAGAGNLFALGFAIAFILIWYLSFYITAFDIAQNNRENKALYLLLTTGLYSILFIGCLTALLLFTDIYSII